MQKGKTKMKTLGVSMIVKNESGCIEACLESIKDADEIVIVDTGSDDATVEICKKYTDKVYTDYLWQDDFAEARNVSLSRCTTDFVLIIDADEVLNCSVVGIKHILNNFMTKSVEGHVFRYMGMMFTVKTQVETVESIRVIRRDESVKWVSAVHNMLTIDGDNDKLRKLCYKSNFEINSGYSPAHFIDPDRSLRILTKQLEVDPTNTRYMYYIAREYISRRMNPLIKDDNTAIDALLDNIIYWLEKHESLTFNTLWTNELADGLYCLALAYFEKVITTKDVNWWYKGVVTAMKSFMVLPSYKAPAKLLSDAMMRFPTGDKYPAASQFWSMVSEKANNMGVMQVRDVKN